jgi:hypothetical protein
MLPSLEAAKAALESQILLIRQHLNAEEAAATAPDPTVLGVDSIGRIIRKRTLSPEVLEKKRQIMRGIRDKRIKDIAELKKLRAEREARGTAAPAGKKK